jgi:hypothetical protein
MNRGSLAGPIRFLCFLLIFLLTGFLNHLTRPEVLCACPQSGNPRERLHSVLSRQKLTPPLRSASVLLRYSPDGRYMLLQNPSGIYILSHNPLRLLEYIRAPNSYKATFSVDSRTVAAVSFGLRYRRWNIPEGKRVESKDLNIPDGCVDAQPSPDGELLACYRPDFTLGLYQLSTDQWVLSERLNSPDPRFSFFPVPLDLDTAFAGAFGFILSNDLKPFANRHIIRLTMAFSPDGRTLIAGDSREAVRIDLAARKKVSLSGNLQKHLTGTFIILGENRALVIGHEKPSRPAILSLTNGDVLANPAFKADSAHLADNSRYALLHDAGASGVRAFDLEQNLEVNLPENIGASIYSTELALYTETGDLFLYRLGEKLPFAASSLSLDGLPVLRSASLAPRLDTLALAVDGEGGIFRIDAGKCVANFPRFSAANLVDESTGFLLMPGRWPAPQEVLQVNTETGATSPTWIGGEKSSIRSGGSVLLEYSLESPMGRGILVVSERGVPFMLRALNPANGKELWKKTFTEDPPIPFADPQGNHLILGWRAKTVEARDAANHSSAGTKEAFKKAKLGKHDSFFEVLDANSGKSLGGVLVQAGSGPASFESAFSEGGMVFLQKDIVRVSVYSLLDSQLKSRLVGVRLAANAQSNLFALSEESDRLSIYDLHSFARLDQQLFSDDLAYIHFSADGQRLFVLTEYQEAFILDLSRVRELSEAAHRKTAEKN